MGNKLYVGNLPYSVRDGDLEQAFGAFGAVTSAKVMMERDTGRSKGFGFVEMGSDAEAQAAIEGMNGQSLGGRNVVVNEARPMEARPPRTGGGGFGGGRREGGGGYGGGGGGYGGGRREGGGGYGEGGGGGFRSPYGSGPRGGGRREGGGGYGEGGGGKTYHCHDGLPEICAAGILAKWFSMTRLETRTKESNTYASSRVENPDAQ